MQTSGSLIRPVASSFPLHIFLSLSVIFVPAWWALTLALLIYKGTQLPYPPTALGFEITITFFIWIIQYWGVKLGKRGNMTESSGILIVGLVLLIFSTGGMFYYTFGQTYVMRLDRGFSVTLLVLNVLCILLGAVAMKDFGATPMTAAQQQQQVAEQQQAQEEQQMQQMMMMNGGGNNMNNNTAAQEQQQQEAAMQQQQQWQQQQQQDPNSMNNNNNNNNNNIVDQQQQQQPQEGMWQPSSQNLDQQQQPPLSNEASQGNMVPPPGVG